MQNLKNHVKNVFKKHPLAIQSSKSQFEDKSESRHFLHDVSTPCEAVVEKSQTEIQKLSFQRCWQKTIGLINLFQTSNMS